MFTYLNRIGIRPSNEVVYVVESYMNVYIIRHMVTFREEVVA